MKDNKKSIGRTLLAGSAIFVLIICLVMGAVGFMTYYNGVIGKYQGYLTDVLQLAMTEIDGDDLETCIETTSKSPAFEKAQSFLDRIKENYNIEYIYVIKPLNAEETDNIMDVMAGITAEEKKLDFDFYSVRLGELTGTDYSSKVAKLYLDGMNADDVTFFSNRTEFGYDYTGMKPIKNSKGDPVALLCVDISMQEITSMFNRYLIALILNIVILSAIALYVIYKWLHSRVIDPLERLEETSRSFVESTHTATSPDELQFADPNIHTGDEMESLSNSLTGMFTNTKKYMTDLVAVTSEKERIGAELNVATKIQADMLPRIFPAFPNRPEFDIYASMDPAKEVGGDFYDFFMIDDNHIGLVMADVSGKGVPAALFMVISKTLIKNRAMLGGDPADIMNYVNDQLCEGNDADLFVTVWFAIVDLTTGKGVAVNAGHEHPAIRRKGEQYELDVYRHSPIVGTVPGMIFRQHDFQLNPGDTLFVYTDGVPEATNSEKELFGAERMVEALNRYPDCDLEELLVNVRKDVDTFVGPADQFDDLTMMAFYYKGKQ